MKLDPGAEKLVAASRASGRPPVEMLPLHEARAAVVASTPLLNGEPPEMGDVRNLTVNGRNGPIAVRLYRPPAIEENEVAPALLFLHGGGWLLGDLDTHDILCRRIALAGDCRLISVDYRRAPESRFPAALDDTVDAVRWLFANAGDLRIDAKRVGVGGDSAGGNLSAVAALMARDGDLPPLAFQLLLYPVCDVGMAHDSYARNAEGYLLTRATMAYFIENYLSGPSDVSNWRASPLRAPSLRGTAPAFILTAGFDPLCDEGIAYAARLIEEGVTTEHVHLAGQIHGFLTAGAIVSEVDHAIDRIGAFLRRSLAAESESSEDEAIDIAPSQPIPSQPQPSRRCGSLL